MCNMHQIDIQKSEAFAERMLDLINTSALSLMTSVGHRTGLFDTMKDLAPSTSKQIADAAGLHERYVREWLNAMTVGRIVNIHVNGSNGREPLYSLPKEHASFLTREAGADNFAVFTQYIPLLGSVEDKIVESFKRGGGVPYSEFKRFHEIMAEDSGLSVVSSLTDVILPIIPGITEKLDECIEVLDVGCGRGRALNMLAEKFPKSRFTGYDLSEEAIAYARETAQKNNSVNVRFEVLDLTTFDIDAPEKRYDFITSFDAIHDQARPDRVLAGIYKALKDDGVYLMQDIAGSSKVSENFDHPLGPFLYTASTMHCMTVSLSAGGLGLGTMWGKEKALEMLGEAGFGNVDVKSLEHDVQNYYYVVRK
jgi:2-polyprenyl-3-methyl-5-hydroxy-6-metoxy-1,4-benzoquinol methylase